MDKPTTNTVLQLPIKVAIRRHKTRLEGLYTRFLTGCVENFGANRVINIRKIFFRRNK